MMKYVYILIAFLLVALLAFGFWERGQAIGARADAKSLSDQLTTAQSDLLIARTVQHLDATQSIRLDSHLDLNIQTKERYVKQQATLEKTDVSVATYLATPVPPALRQLLDEEDGLAPHQPCADYSSGQPQAGVPGASPYSECGH